MRDIIEGGVHKPDICSNSYSVCLLVFYRQHNIEGQELKSFQGDGHVPAMQLSNNVTPSRCI